MWIKTNPHVYRAISFEHRADLTVHGSFTNTERSTLSERYEVLTEWGFKNSNRPLIKLHRIGELDAPRENDVEHFYIYCAKESES